MLIGRFLLHPNANGDRSSEFELFLGSNGGFDGEQIGISFGIKPNGGFPFGSADFCGGFESTPAFFGGS